MQSTVKAAEEYFTMSTCASCASSMVTTQANNSLAASLSCRDRMPSARLPKKSCTEELSPTCASIPRGANNSNVQNWETDAQNIMWKTFTGTVLKAHSCKIAPRATGS